MFSYYLIEQSRSHLGEQFLKVLNSFFPAFIQCELSYSDNLLKPPVLLIEGGPSFSFALLSSCHHQVLNLWLLFVLSFSPTLIVIQINRV